MCLAVPTQIKRIDGEMAEVELDGVRRTVSLVMVPDAQADDYVLVHAGYAITVVDEDDAMETLRLLQQLECVGQEETEQAG
jgi:hydrogenase expression/formation protein HypC